MLRRYLCLITLASLVTACTPGPESPRGFSLPQGDPELGAEVFRESLCLACHSLPGEDRGDIVLELPTPVALGGEVTRIATYADLVTSIINPSHRIAKGYKPYQVEIAGESKMRNYNDAMTVTELVNLVAFLQPKYTLKEFEHTEYAVYP